MDHNRIIRPLEKALRFYAVLALAIVIFQGVGLLMYAVNVWPNVRAEGLSGDPMRNWMAALLIFAVVMGFSRSFIWIRIYWDGSKAFSLVRSFGGSSDLADQLSPVLSNLTRLLVGSCVLDVLFLPAYFLSGSVLPFPLAGWRLGSVEVARILFPQAFGIAALILAFLTHQYGQLVKERGTMRAELELTI